MNPGKENNTARLNHFVRQLAAKKKKTVMALSLTGVMVFMWVRVIRGKGPKDAGAAMVQTATKTEQLVSRPEISFVELPKVKGRNDMLTQDFFVLGQGRLDCGEKVKVVPGDSGAEVVRRIAKRLRLEAIGFGDRPWAFINGKLLSAGDRLKVKDEGNVYECEVIGIEKNTVFIRFEKAEIRLKLTQATTIEN